MTIYTGPYKGAVRCTSGPQPGAWGAMDYYTSAYKSKGAVSDGIYNCRSVRGGKTTSIHGEGRAADFGVRPYGAAYGTALANAIVAMSKELGVQCVIWNRRIWSSAYPHSGWRHYSGVDPHTGHLHVELTWSMANKSRATVAKHWAKVLGGIKPGDVKIGGGSSGGSSYGSASAKHEVGSRVMKRWHGGSDVRWLQKRLYKCGYKITPKKNGTFDGLFGTELEAAVKKLQKAAKITVDGLAGKDTIAAAKKAKVTRQLPKTKTTSASGAKFPLAKGHFYYTEDRRSTVHSGYWPKDRPAIRKIQKKVGTGVDGRYGDKTKAAVMRWQKKHGLKADGAVGRVTWSKMLG